LIKQTSPSNRCVLLVCEQAPYDVNQDWFNPLYWQNQKKIIGTSTGRHTTYFFQHNHSDFVLRHYYRGGLFGKLVKDSYWFSSLETTRAYRELELLLQLRALGLNAPNPTAARITRAGLFYQADIIIEKIPNAKDAFHSLCSAPLDESIWRNIGHCIRQFHNHQVFHSDLNIHNIMLDDQHNIWLIDFDKCEIRNNRKDDEWKQANLQRLKRSLVKEKNKHTSFCWQEQDWQWLLEGYQS
jgi:3-deoxy-D-manno-octulosonic acid kinase